MSILHALNNIIEVEPFSYLLQGRRVQNRMANIVRENQMFCLLLEIQIDGLLCDENPQEDTNFNSCNYGKEMFKYVQHEHSSSLIEQESPCMHTNVALGSHRLNNQKRLS
jgi:hypothetical protein